MLTELTTFTDKTLLNKPMVQPTPKTSNVPLVDIIPDDSFDESVCMEEVFAEEEDAQSRIEDTTNAESETTPIHNRTITKICSNETSVPHITAKNYKFQSQNVQGMKKEFKIESIFAEMIANDINIYCVQEIWLEGTWEKNINDYLFIHHGVSKCGCKRGNRGVEISYPHICNCVTIE